MSSIYCPEEITLHEAMEESVIVADILQAMAQRTALQRTSEAITITRRWTPSARTYTYHTHVQVPCADSTVLKKVADCFFYAVALPTQPWYAQFLRGQLESLPAAQGSSRAVLCVPEFDFGLGKTHSYRQVVNDFSPVEHCRVLVLRSVIHALDFPPDTRPAFTLTPTGDVFHWQAGILHWHHICTVSGVGIMPSSIERHVMNALRWLHLDMAERKTYRQEAESFIRWVSDPGHVDVTWQSIAAMSANQPEQVAV